MEDEHPLVTLEEMAKLLGIHPQTLRRLHLTGKVRSYKLSGTLLRFDPREVREDVRQENYKKRHRK